MLKKALYIFIIFVLVISITGCSGKSDCEQAEDAKPVKVQEVKEENIPLTLDYIGRVDSSEVKKYSFKSSGIIEDVCVEKGQVVDKGQKLVQIDTRDLTYSAEAACSQMEAARAQYNKAVNGASKEETHKAELNVKKAQDAYNYSKDIYDKTKVLYENDAISKNTLDKAKLDLDLRFSELNQAVEVEQEVKRGVRKEDKEALLRQLEMAEANYELKKSLLENAELKSNMEGYVVDILPRKGELVAAGTPVAAVRSNKMVVNIGVIQDDMHKIDMDMQAEIDIDSRSFTGKVIRIDQVPDRQTWTYNVQLELPDDSLYIGTVAKVAIEVEEDRGIWIPISCITSSENDYVFVESDGKAILKNVTIKRSNGNMVLVEGLVSRDKVVVEGMKSLTDGDRIEIKE